MLRRYQLSSAERQALSDAGYVVTSDDRGQSLILAGRLHDGPNGEPALVNWDHSTGVVILEWRCQYGKLHDGVKGEPVTVERGPTTEVVTLEGRFHHGVGQDSAGGAPAFVARDPETGRVTRELHGRSGRPHDGPNGEPAPLIRDPATGRVLYAARAIDGKLVRLSPSELATLSTAAVPQIEPAQPVWRLLSSPRRLN